MGVGDLGKHSELDLGTAKKLHFIGWGLSSFQREAERLSRYVPKVRPVLEVLGRQFDAALSVVVARWFVLRSWLVVLS